MKRNKQRSEISGQQSAARTDAQRAHLLNSQLSTLNSQRCRAAFTLIELMIVVGIIAYTGNLRSPVILNDSTQLAQVGKLAKIENLHLRTFSAPAGPPPPDTFDTRPAVASTASQMGDTVPPNPSLTFYYPVGGSQ